MWLTWLGGEGDGQRGEDVCDGLRGERGCVGGVWLQARQLCHAGVRRSDQPLVLTAPRAGAGARSTSSSHSCAARNLPKPDLVVPRQPGQNWSPLELSGVGGDVVDLESPCSYDLWGAERAEVKTCSPTQTIG